MHMITMAMLTEFLGWCVVLNVGLLVYATVMITVFRGFVERVHRRFFPLADDELDRAYFTFLGNYKLAVVVFNLVPYCALKLMA